MRVRHDPLPKPHHRLLCAPEVRPALIRLLEGYEYATDLQSSVWDFAVDLDSLLQAGSTVNALRWLVRRGCLEYHLPAAKEIPGQQDGGRLQFPSGTCFVLTEGGVTVARTCHAPEVLAHSDPGTRVSLRAAAPEVPVWNPEAGELRYHGEVVKRFRNGASNQRKILDEFQKQHWPAELADPLPADRQVNRKRRLHDTIKNLNRGQEVRSVRFYGTDSGHAVGWCAHS